MAKHTRFVKVKLTRNFISTLKKYHHPHLQFIPLSAFTLPNRLSLYSWLQPRILEAKQKATFLEAVK